MPGFIAPGATPSGFNGYATAPPPPRPQRQRKRVHRSSRLAPTGGLRERLAASKRRREALAPTKVDLLAEPSAAAAAAAAAAALADVEPGPDSNSTCAACSLPFFSASGRTLCTTCRPKPVAYVHSERLLALTSMHPTHPERAVLVHTLLVAYGLTAGVAETPEARVGRAELSSFHSRAYIKFLQQPSEGAAHEFGCEDDCAIFPRMWEYAVAVAGGTLAASRSLIDGSCRAAIHWNGGRHHARSDSAAGFCYVNDICLGVMELLKLGKVMYVDLDCHHGDSVEQAFAASPSVYTLSLHRFGPGFYPGTGAACARGSGAGRGYTLNLPLKEGITDAPYVELFSVVSSAVRAAFEPAVIVLQCGADALAHDPLGELNLTPQAFVECWRIVEAWGKPVLLLGGGGYNSPNTARCYALLTAAVLRRVLPDEIPEHDGLECYGPDFRLAVPASHAPDRNDAAYLEALQRDALRTIEKAAAKAARAAS